MKLYIKTEKDTFWLEMPIVPRLEETIVLPKDDQDVSYLVTEVKHVMTPENERSDKTIYHYTAVYLEEIE